jgi:hypothetical protein
MFHQPLMAQLLPTRQLPQHHKKAQASRRQTTAHYNSQKILRTKNCAKNGAVF